MEYSDAISTVFERLRDPKGYVVIDQSSAYKYTTEELEDLLDDLGELSRKARNLSTAITSSVKFAKDQLLYLRTNGNNIIGFAKINRNKKIFKTDDFGCYQEVKITAILDFYIHPFFELQGYGKALLNHILETEYLTKNSIGVLKPSKSFIGFFNCWTKNKSTMKNLDDDYVAFSIPEYKEPEKPQGSLGLIKSGSQTNLNALSSVQKSNSQSSRGSIFNTIGKGVLAQSTQDLAAMRKQNNEVNYNQDYSTQRQEETRKEIYNPVRNSPLDMKIQKGDFANPLLTTRNERHMKFDEYLSQYEQAKRSERNKSPGESRSKYFNDVFKSNVNLGSTGKGVPSHIKKIMMEIDSKGAYVPKAEHGTPFKSEHSYGYIPEFPNNTVFDAVQSLLWIWKNLGLWKNFQQKILCKKLCLWT